MPTKGTKNLLLSYEQNAFACINSDELKLSKSGEKYLLFRHTLWHTTSTVLKKNSTEYISINLPYVCVSNKWIFLIKHLHLWNLVMVSALMPASFKNLNIKPNISGIWSRIVILFHHESWHILWIALYEKILHQSNKSSAFQNFEKTKISENLVLSWEHQEISTSFVISPFFLQRIDPQVKTCSQPWIVPTSQHNYFYFKECIRKK